MPALRAKSERLTGYLRFLLDRLGGDRFEVITPDDPAAGGCQLSILVHDQPRACFEALQAAGVVCDYREPNVIRAAPVPLGAVTACCVAIAPADGVLPDLPGRRQATG